MLQTQSLEYSYDGQEFLKFPDIACQKGEQWLLLGKSGSGKTTLLHLLGGLRKPQRGQVVVDGTALDSLSGAGLDQFRGKHIGIVFQQPHFVRSLSVLENMQLAQYLAGEPTSKDRISQLLDRLNIGHKLDDRPDQLSQGEQQRLAIARALVNRPTVILADEPTSALDDENCEEVVQLLERQAQEEQATLMIVTHDGRLKERFEHQILL